MSKRIILSLLTSILMISCEPVIYRAVNDRGYSEAKANPVTRKLILLNSHYVTDYNEYIKLLNTKDWTHLEEKVKTIDDANTRNFLLGIRFLMDKQPAKAYQLVSQIPDFYFDCQVKIVKADCLHELKSDTVDIRKRYQDAWDCTPETKIKSIAETRFRFIKYYEY